MEKSKLVRGMGLSSAIAVVVGAVVGSAILLVPAEVSQNVGSPGMALMVWGAAGVVSLLGGLTFSELGAAYPGTGGPYLYLGEAFGPVVGYLYGWTLALIIQPGSIAAEAAGISQFLPHLIAVSPLTTRLIATAVIVFFTLLNLIDIRAGTWVLDLTTGLKFLTLIVLGAAGCLLAAPYSLWTGSLFREFSATSFGVALIAAFWTYDGWSNLSFVAGEVKSPERNLPLANIIGIGSILAIFLFINAGFYRFLSLSAIAGSGFAGGDVARAMGGSAAFACLSGAVIFATLNCTNATILAGGRMAYAMAEGGDLPAWLSYVHPRYRVPSAALLVQAALTLLLLWSGTYAQLFTYVMCAAFVFYALSALALLVLRRTRPDLPRPFRVPFYPYLPLVYLAATLLFLSNAVLAKPKESLLGMGMVLLGIPVFYLGRRR